MGTIDAQVGALQQRNAEVSSATDNLRNDYNYSKNECNGEVTTM